MLSRQLRLMTVACCIDCAVCACIQFGIHSRSSQITRGYREMELTTQLLLPFQPRYRKMHRFLAVIAVLAVLAVLCCCMVDITSPSFFPESMQQGVERADLIRASKA